MDEYDVFLDQMARKLTLDILAEYARDKEQQGRQFIIITPQDLRHMTTSDEVRIHKMPDPERIHTNEPQQQTLNF
jgi:chromosome segregation ATPase